MWQKFQLNLLLLYCTLINIFYNIGATCINFYQCITTNEMWWIYKNQLTMVIDTKLVVLVLVFYHGSQNATDNY